MSTNRTNQNLAICGTCCAVVDPFNSDEGYSHCCNDRIEYGLEASETIQRRIEELDETIVENRKKIASLASRISVGRRDGKDVAGLELEVANLRAWQSTDKAEAKRLAKTQKGF